MAPTNEGADERIGSARHNGLMHASGSILEVSDSSADRPFSNISFPFHSPSASGKVTSVSSSSPSHSHLSELDYHDCAYVKSNIPFLASPRRRGVFQRSDGASCAEDPPMEVNGEEVMGEFSSSPTSLSLPASSQEKSNKHDAQDTRPLPNAKLCPSTDSSDSMNSSENSHGTPANKSTQRLKPILKQAGPTSSWFCCGSGYANVRGESEDGASASSNFWCFRSSYQVMEDNEESRTSRTGVRFANNYENETDSNVEHRNELTTIGGHLKQQEGELVVRETQGVGVPGIPVDGIVSADLRSSGPSELSEVAAATAEAAGHHDPEYDGDYSWRFACCGGVGEAQDRVTEGKKMLPPREASVKVLAGDEGSVSESDADDVPSNDEQTFLDFFGSCMPVVKSTETGECSLMTGKNASKPLKTQRNEPVAHSSVLPRSHVELSGLKEVTTIYKTRDCQNRLWRYRMGKYGRNSVVYFWEGDAK